LHYDRRIDIWCNTKSENSEYTNYAGNNKDCYLVFGNGYGQNEKCMYGNGLSKCYFSCDGIQCIACEYCYEIIDCDACTRLLYSSDCINCHQSYFLYDCTWCNNCIGCFWLKNKQYCILNKQYTPEEYQKIKDSFSLETRKWIQTTRERVQDFFDKQPHKSSQIEECEWCSGNYVYKSSNCQMCFDTTGSENCKYLRYSVDQDFDVSDTAYVVDTTDSYECMSLVQWHHILFSNITWWNVADLLYCDTCTNCTSCFACVWLQHKQYCIFNKQYTKEEYEKLVARIITKMQDDDERGEFFPESICPFAYNESVAQEFFPLTPWFAKQRWYNWGEKQNTSWIWGITVDTLPAKISEVDDSVLQKVIICEKTWKPFRITKLELQLYRKLGIPLPWLHPNERHQKRIEKRWGSTLHLRKDSKTGEEIVSIYPETVSFPVYGLETYGQVEF